MERYNNNPNWPRWAATTAARPARLPSTCTSAWHAHPRALFWTPPVCAWVGTTRHRSQLATMPHVVSYYKNRSQFDGSVVAAYCRWALLRQHCDVLAVVRSWSSAGSIVLTNQDHHQFQPNHRTASLLPVPARPDLQKVHQCSIFLQFFLSFQSLHLLWFPTL